MHLRKVVQLRNTALLGVRLGLRALEQVEALLPAEVPVLPLALLVLLQDLLEVAVVDPDGLAELALLLLLLAPRELLLAQPLLLLFLAPLLLLELLLEVRDVLVGGGGGEGWGGG